MNRRDFLFTAGAMAPSLEFGRLLAEDASRAAWRTFEIVTRVDMPVREQPVRVWLPAGLVVETPYQKTVSNHFEAPGGAVRLVESKADGLGIVTAEFGAGVKPAVTLTSRVATRDYAIDLSAHGRSSKASRAEPEFYLRPTRLLPTDGIVRDTAAQITKSSATDVEKARAIYEWIVDNTLRNPKTRGAASVIFASCWSPATCAGSAQI
jgi:transglutaminase-like putative cysteine protease